MCFSSSFFAHNLRPILRRRAVLSALPWMCCSCTNRTSKENSHKQADVSSSLGLLTSPQGWMDRPCQQRRDTCCAESRGQLKRTEPSASIKAYITTLSRFCQSDSFLLHQLVSTFNLITSIVDNGLLLYECVRYLNLIRLKCYDCRLLRAAGLKCVKHCD